MLEDATNGKLSEIRAFAEKVGKAAQLKEKLDYLGNYSDRETKCVLYRDFAPHSLSFTMEEKVEGDWRPWFNGGLIFHGNHDGFGSGEAPTLSVCVNPTDGWSVHT